MDRYLFIQLITINDMSFILQADGLQERTPGDGIIFESGTFMTDVNTDTTMSNPVLSLNTSNLVVKRVITAGPSPLTNNGDLFTYTAGANAALPVGSSDQILAVSPATGLPYWASKYVGELDIVGNSTATNATSFSPIAGTWILGSNTNGFSMGSNGLITYNGAVTRTFHVCWGAAFSTTVADADVTIQLYYNGSTAIPRAASIGTTFAPNTWSGSSGRCIMQLVPNDTLQLQILSDGLGNQNVIVNSCSFIICAL
jgi:hypothetical protein